MNTKKNKTTEKKYILSEDLPFGNLKKDTIFTYNAITKVASFPNGVQISDFDISNSKFVKKCVDISFKIDDIVLYENCFYKVTHILDLVHYHILLQASLERVDLDGR